MAKLSSSLAFLMEILKKKPDLSYADAAAAAKKRRLKVYPIMYGRAKALLGLVPMKKRGEGKAAKAAKAKKAGKRGPGRPRKASSGGGDGAGLERLVELVRSEGKEREQLRAALEKVRDVVENALG